MTPADHAAIAPDPPGQTGKPARTPAHRRPRNRPRAATRKNGRHGHS